MLICSAFSMKFNPLPSAIVAVGIPDEDSSAHSALLPVQIDYSVALNIYTNAPHMM